MRSTTGIGSGCLRNFASGIAVASLDPIYQPVKIEGNSMTPLLSSPSQLMQCHAGKININVESYVEVVGEDIQRNISDNFGGLSVREALVAKRL